MNVFLACGLIFVLALGTSRLLGRIKFPAVTSYVLFGILTGPYGISRLLPEGLKLVPDELVRATEAVGYLVLGIVSFSLGESFLLSEFRKVRKQMLVISIGDVLGPLILVSIALWLIRQPLAISLIFGAIAAATAPMTTIMIVRESRSRGSFTKLLLDIVAIDDAWGIIIFALCVSAARILLLPGIENPFGSALFEALREILGAILSGVILGLLLSFLSRYSRTQTESLIFSLGFILMMTGISLKSGFSPLLANMAMGVTVINITRRHLFFDVLRRIDWPLYLLFFVLCGASLQVPLLSKLSIIALVYVAARTAGKYAGVRASCYFAKAEEKVKRYLGLALVPQAGVALGLAIMAKAVMYETGLPHYGELILTTTIATTIIFELVGPFCTRFAITKAGEAAK